MSIDYAKYLSDLVARAKAAQEVANGYSQERVDELCAAKMCIRDSPSLSYPFHSIFTLFTFINIKNGELYKIQLSCYKTSYIIVSSLTTLFQVFIIDS